MKHFLFVIVALIIIPVYSFTQNEATTLDGKKVLLYDDGSWIFADSIPLYYIKAKSIPNLEIPATTSKDKIIKHAGYTVLFNDKNKQAKWVAYELTKDETTANFTRTDAFLLDPQLKSNQADQKDYYSSGYDRGHLAPAADMSYSPTTMEESFYYSNICPQEPSFNRGIWKRLESLVRAWAIENSAIYIVTGPVFKNSNSTIGPHKILVPTYFYKVILDYTEPEIKGIGFIMPNSASTAPLQTFAVTIDSVERYTGIDFFPSLPDDQEAAIEKTLCIKCWSWASSSTETQKEEKKLSVSVQCNGTTKAGNRCKNKTLNPSGYCYLHENQNPSKNSTNTEVKNTDKPTGTNENGQTIYTGPRGGQYHYSSSGKKVYEKKK